MIRSTGRAARSEARETLALPGATGYAAAVFGVALVSVLARALRPGLDASHTSLLYLVVVAVVAYGAGAGPAVLGAFLSFLSWNYFFIEPTGTFYVHEARDLITLIAFLAVAVLTGGLAGRAREQAIAAQERERETAMLYEIGMAMGAAPDVDTALARVLELVVGAVGAAGGAILLPETGGALRVAARHGTEDTERLGFDWRARARDVIASGAPVGWDPPETGGPVLLPLRVGDRIIGAMIVAPRGRHLSWRQRRLILAAASHAAIAIERHRLAAEAGQAEVLRAAEEFRSTLLSSVSHDLRTPLASIKATVTSLLHAESAHSPEARRELLQAVDEETDRLNTFVGALLDISRLEAGAWQPEKDWFDLVDVVGTVLGRLSDRESARVQVQIPPDLPLVPVDGIQMGQAIWNLVENALKFSPPPRPVEIQAYAADPETLRIAVSDCGPGIPPGEEGRIFEKFYRVSGDRRPEGVPGAGLGLAIARGVVEAHGGRIRAMNRPGGGATFELLLPLRPPEMPPPRDIEEPDEEDADAG